MLMVDRNVPLGRLAQALDCQNELLTQLNPAYKKDIIDGRPEKPRRLVIPVETNISDSAVYVALNEHIDINLASSDRSGTHRVVPGETLQDIAVEYGTTVQNILAWNELRRNTPITGRLLTVRQPAAHKETPEKLVADRSGVKNPTYLTYVVRRGDTLSDIASRHGGVSVRKLKADNQLQNSRLRIGQKLKIYKGNG